MKGTDVVDAIFGTKEQIVHRGYGATERQIGAIYAGWRITQRHKIPQWKRWMYDGKSWEFYGIPVTKSELDVDWDAYDLTHHRRGIETAQADEMIYRWLHRNAESDPDY